MCKNFNRTLNNDRSRIERSYAGLKNSQVSQAKIPVHEETRPYYRSNYCLLLLSQLCC